MSLEGKIAVVTGSSSGIGRGIALRLSDAGCHVVLHGRDSVDALEEVTAEIRGKGRSADVVQADLTNGDQLAGLVERIWTSIGPIDIWINNAGADVLTGAHRGLRFDQKLDLLWKTDVVPTLLLSRDVGQRMRDTAQSRASGAGEYAILNMGWDQAYQGMAGEAGELFSTAKGAIMSASLSLAQTFAPHVRVNCLAPGWIRTAWGQSASEAWQVRAIQESLMARWGSPDDVASMAEFLVSPQASFISGQIFYINGGFRFGQDVGS